MLALFTLAGFLIHSRNFISRHTLLLFPFLSLLNFGILTIFRYFIRKNIFVRFVLVRFSICSLSVSLHMLCSMYTILFSVRCCCCCCYLSFFHTFASVSSKLTNALPEMIWYTLLVPDFNRNYCLSR